MSTQSVSSTPQKEYRMIGIWRYTPFYVLAMCLAFSLFFLILFFTTFKLDNASRIVMLIGTLIFLVLGGLLYFGSRGTRLVTSPQGVIFYGVGYRVYSPWDNIKGIGEGQYGGNRNVVWNYQAPQRVEGLLLRQLAMPGVSVADGIRNHMAVIDSNRLLLTIIVTNIARYGNLIPLRGFINDTVREELLADAKHYAPENFKEAEGLRFSSKPIFQSEEG